MEKKSAPTGNPPTAPDDGVVDWLCRDPLVSRVVGACKQCVWWCGLVVLACALCHVLVTGVLLFLVVRVTGDVRTLRLLATAGSHPPFSMVSPSSL